MPNTNDTTPAGPPGNTTSPDPRRPRGSSTFTDARTPATLAPLADRIDADKIVDELLGDLADLAPDTDSADSLKAYETARRELTREALARAITAGQDAGREIVRLEREAALDAALRNPNAGVLLSELGLDALKWAEACARIMRDNGILGVRADVGQVGDALLGWFANAIETAKDAAGRGGDPISLPELRARLRESPEPLAQFFISAADTHSSGELAFAVGADRILQAPRNAERTVGLRKLLEALEAMRRSWAWQAPPIAAPDANPVPAPVHR